MTTKNAVGQSTIEYALMLAMLVGTVIIIVQVFGQSVRDIYNRAVLCGFSDQTSCEVTIVADDFDTLDRNIWEIGNWHGKKDVDWSIEDGILSGSEGAFILLKDSVGLSDYAITIDDSQVKLDGNKKWQGFTVLFNAAEDKKGVTGYGFRIQKRGRSDDDNYLYFAKIVNGKVVYPTLTEIVELPDDIDFTNPGDIRVEVRGDTYTAYIDGEQVAQAQDSTFTEGSAGLINHINGSNSFSGFNIEGLP